MKSTSGLIQDSEAIRNCAEKGGSLPTYEDYKTLMHFFERIENHHEDQLTELGRSHLNGLWRQERIDDTYLSYWTRTIHWFAKNYIFIYVGGSMYPSGRDTAYARCVKYPEDSR